MIRTDTIRHSANGGKADRLMKFVRSYRECCAAIAAAEWRSFFETGKFGGKFLVDPDAPNPVKGEKRPRKKTPKGQGRNARFNDICGAAPAQMARVQVAGMLSSFLSNRQNEFRDAVQRSKLDPGMKHMLRVINTRKAWHVRADVAMPKTGEVIPADVRKLGLTIWRSIRKRHRRTPAALPPCWIPASPR